MKRMIATVLGVIMIFAATTAMAIPLTDLVNGGSFTLGDKTFSNFFAVLNNQGNSAPTDLSGITITPILLDPTHMGFSISGDFIAYAPPTSTVDLLLGYKCTASAGLIHDVELAFDGAVLRDPAFSSVTETVYKNGFPTVGTQIGQLTVFTPSPLSSSIILSEDVNTIFVTKDIELSAFESGVVTLSNITQMVSQVPVPEPGTIVLLGAGLLGLGFYGRKRIKS